MKKVLIALIVFVLVALMGTAVFAQEATETPTAPAGDAAATADPNAAQTTPEGGDAGQGGVDLEGLTADAGAYVGQTVRLEGVVDNLLNIRAFVLGEGAALDNDQVLVINTSGEEFDIRLTEGSRFAVTGVVYPSFADGGLTQIVAQIAEMGGTDAMATAEATESAGGAMARSTDLVAMIIPDDLFNHTIIQVQSIDDIQLLALPE